MILKLRGEIVGLETIKIKSVKNANCRVRGKLSGTADRPRLNVFHLTGIYAQVIDDVAGVNARKRFNSTKKFQKELN